MLNGWDFLLIIFLSLIAYGCITEIIKQISFNSFIKKVNKMEKKDRDKIYEMLDDYMNKKDK